MSGGVGLTMSSSQYLAAIQEVRQWLSYKKLDEFIYLLLDNGYDDLESIALCNQEEMAELESLFQESDSRRAMHVLVDSLRQVGIDAYRRQKSEFRRLTQIEDTASPNASPTTSSRLTDASQSKASTASSPFKPASTTALSAPSSASSSSASSSSTSSSSNNSDNLATAEKRAIETRSRVASNNPNNPRPPHAYAHVKKDGYASIRITSSTNIGPWLDKFIVLEGTELKWFSSRRDLTIPEYTFSLYQCITSVSSPDSTTVLIQTTNMNMMKLELGCNNRGETEEWITAFSYLWDDANVNNTNNNGGNGVANGGGASNGKLAPMDERERRPSLNAIKKICVVDDCSSPAFGKSPYCTLHHNQYRRASQMEDPIYDPPSNGAGGDDQDMDANDLYPQQQGGAPQVPPRAVSLQVMQATRSSSVMGSNVHVTVDDIVMEDAQMDRNTLEGCLAAYARVRARIALARCVADPIDEEELNRRLSQSRASSQMDRKVTQMLDQLAEGAIFTKFKRGNSSKRSIWCTPMFDYVVWGDTEKQTVKGMIPTMSIQEINQGFGKNKCRLYIVSEGRTLELEAKDANMAKEWKSLFELLIQSNNMEIEIKMAIKDTPEFIERARECEREYVKLVCEGDIFKKWPGKKKIQKGGATSRKLWASENVDRLQWGDIENNKVKGFLLVQDVVEVHQDPSDKVKFTVYAVKRSLDLEAKSVWVREKWLRALRFFVEMKKR